MVGFVVRMENEQVGMNIESWNGKSGKIDGKIPQKPANYMFFIV